MVPKERLSRPLRRRSPFLLAAELPRERRERVLLDLADTLRREVQLVRDLVERVRLAVEPEMTHDDLPLAHP